MWKVGAGTAAVGGIFVYRELSKPKTHSIRNLLASKNPNKRLISRSLGVASDEWKAAWKLYATSYKDSDLNPFSLSSKKPITTPDGSQNAPEEFMGKCESLSNEHVFDEGDNRYKNVLKYCTRFTLVSDLIFENYPNRKILSSSEQKDGDGWTAALNRYKEFNKGKATLNSDEWKLPRWPISSSNDGEVLVDLKTKCGEKLKLKVFDKEDKDYKNAVEWCTN